jgi:hypothetical protein
MTRRIRKNFEICRFTRMHESQPDMFAVWKQTTGILESRMIFQDHFDVSVNCKKWTRYVFDFDNLEPFFVAHFWILSKFC